MTDNRLLFFLFAIICISASAQEANILYFMKHNPMRHELNPAFMPEEAYKMYVGLPGLTDLDFGAGNNSYIFDNIGRVRDGKVETIFDDGNDLGIAEFLSEAHRNIKLDAYAEVGIISWGLRRRDTFWNFAINSKVETNVSLPTKVVKDIFDEVDLDNLTIASSNVSHKFDRFSVSAFAYNEFSFGMAHKFTKFDIGGKFKVLQGVANVNTDLQNITMSRKGEHWKFSGKGTADFLMFGKHLEKDGNQISVEDDEDEDFKVGGYGVALDGGVQFKLFGDRLRLSASVLDFGFIKWKKQASRLRGDLDIEFDMPRRTEDDAVSDYWEDWLDAFDDATEEFDDSYWVEDQKVGYTTMLTTKIFAGVEFTSISDKVSISLLSKTWIYDRNGRQDLVFAGNFRPSKHFDCSLSYDFLNGNFGSIGYGMNFNLGPLNYFVAIDNVPISFTKASKDNVSIPNKLSELHISTGFNILIGWLHRETSTKLVHTNIIDGI